MSHLDRLDVWQSVARDAALLEAVAETDTVPSQIARLRRHWSAEAVHVALDLVEARRRGGRKFPRASSLVLDRAGVEQATSARVATHKAERFRGADAVADLCCGVGGDAMALSAVTDVTAIDLLPVRAWMTAHNAECDIHVADVDKLSMTGGLVHIDPARRDEQSGRRSWNPEDLRPGPETLRRVIDRHDGVAVKLGPGVDRTLPLLAAAEVEFIADNGALVQAVGWFGRLTTHPGQTSATSLRPDGSVLQQSGAPGPLQETTEDTLVPSHHLLVPDPALERAGLVECRRRAIGARGIHPGLGLLTAPEAPSDGWFRAFRILEVTAWRQRELRRALAAHDAGAVVVRTRGRAVETDVWTPRLQGDGHRAIALFALRLGRRIVGVVTSDDLEPAT